MPVIADSRTERAIVSSPNAAAKESALHAIGPLCELLKNSSFTRDISTYSKPAIPKISGEEILSDMIAARAADIKIDLVGTFTNASLSAASAITAAFWVSKFALHGVAAASIPFAVGGIASVGFGLKALGQAMNALKAVSFSPKRTDPELESISNDITEEDPKEVLRWLKSEAEEWSSFPGTLRVKLVSSVWNELRWSEDPIANSNTASALLSAFPPEDYNLKLFGIISGCLLGELTRAFTIHQGTEKSPNDTLPDFSKLDFPELLESIARFAFTPPDTRERLSGIIKNLDRVLDPEKTIQLLVVLRRISAELPQFQENLMEQILGMTSKIENPVLRKDMLEQLKREKGISREDKGTLNSAIEECSLRKTP